jgi:hypothetical protein
MNGEAMAVRPSYHPLSSAALRRILLWGVPSLTLLGLVGAAGVKLWFYRRKKNTAAETSDSTASDTVAIPAAASCIDSASSPPPLGERRASAPASTASGDGLYPRKNSQDVFQERFATPFKLHSSSVGGKQLTSSNLQLLPVEPETASMKPPDIAAAGGNHGPANSSAIRGNSVLEESGSSEGLLSLPSKSPSAKPRAEMACDAFDALSKLKAEPEESEASSKDSNSLPAMYRKDRIRVLLQIPRNVVGRFIGKQGRNIKALMQASNGAHVYVNQKNLPKDAQIVTCTVQGTSVQIKDAMNIISAKYPDIPLPAYPNSIVGAEGDLMQYISSIPSPRFGASVQNGDPWEVELLPAIIPLTSFSATVCYLESVTDIWMVSKEKSMELDDLHQNMSYIFCSTDFGRINVKEGDEAMLGKFCAVRVSEIHWLRGRVSRFGDDPGSYEVQLLDYGSIVVVPPPAIRTLR